MARKNVLTQIYVNSSSAQPINPNGTAPTLSQSLAASFSTVSTDTMFLDNVCYQINITTSDSTGTFYVQVSEDNTNFVDMGQAASAAGANDTAICEVDPGARRYVRLRYSANTAGTGTCQIILTAKNIGD